MIDKEMNKFIVEELQKYAPILEESLHDMADIEFTVEDGKLYLLSACVGKRTTLANLRIVISMFCEGKISTDDVIKKLPYQQLEYLLDKGILIDADQLKQLGSGVPASGGVGAATVCFSYDEAKSLIYTKEKFIYCRMEVSPEDIELIASQYCNGVMTSRGGITSHAAVICRGMGLPCVSGFGNYEGIRNLLLTHNYKVTIDGNSGKIYAGIGKIKKVNSNLPEIRILFELIKLIIKYNITNSEIAPLVWRLWDVLILNRRYGGKNNTKCLVIKKTADYKSFIQPSQNEIEQIYQSLYVVKNGNFIAEDFIGFLVFQLSAQVPLGQHHLYMRPLLNPMDTMCFSKKNIEKRNNPAGVQLLGVEFFHVNQFVDFLIDIYNIKIFFSTEFYFSEESNETNDKYFPINYLDFTNPNGESLIINTYNAKRMCVYINDVLIPADNLAMVYHLIRRRAYYWSWFTENNITKNEILHYLESNAFLRDSKSKINYLCEEMHLIINSKLTVSGISLLGGKNYGKR